MVVAPVIVGTFMTLVDVTRRTVASRPLWVFLAALGAYLLFERIRRHRDPAANRTFPSIRLLCTAAVAYYVAVVVWYGLIPQQVDYAEPSVTAIAWLFAVGKPVYHTIDSPERYSHMYGPMAFVLPGAVLRLLGAGMLIAKAIGSAAALLAIGLTTAAIRKLSDSVATVVAVGICVLEFLCFRNLTFWSRPDPLQLVMVGAGLFAAARMRGAPAVLVMSVSMGILCNLKFTGPLYAMPVFALFYARAGWRPVLLSIVAAAVLAVAPFFVFSNVSWTQYVLWVQLSARNGLRIAALKENIEWAVFFLIPVIVRLSVRRPLGPELRWMIPALLAAFCGVVVAASKPGAGAYHLVPFLPSIAAVTSMSLRDTADHPLRWMLPFVSTLVFVVAVQQQYFFRLVNDPALSDSYRDVRQYLDAHPGERIAVGYTAAERMTFARTVVVFATGEYLLDVPAIQEHQLSGLPLPQSTVDAIRSCAVRTWLIPRAGEPFRIRNDYPSTGYREIFPQELIDAFAQNYRRTGTTRYYDVWECSRGIS
ncbi:MAG TPA: hypothetical protein VH458_23950 [Vicinamibacterales bacterium]